MTTNKGPAKPGKLPPSHKPHKSPTSLPPNIEVTWDVAFVWTRLTEQSWTKLSSLKTLGLPEHDRVRFGLALDCLSRVGLAESRAKYSWRRTKPLPEHAELISLIDAKVRRIDAARRGQETRARNEEAADAERAAQRERRFAALRYTAPTRPSSSPDADRLAKLERVASHPSTPAPEAANALAAAQRLRDRMARGG